MSAPSRVEEVRSALQAADIYVLDQTDVSHGVRLTLHNDGIVTVYNSGKVLVQGKSQDSTKAALAELGVAKPSKVSATTASVERTPRELPNGWRNCPKCEQLLVTTWRYCFRCGAEVGLSLDMVRCAACGEAMDGAWSFCSACGTAAAF